LNSSPLFDFFHTDEELSRQLYGDSQTITIDYGKLYVFDPEYAIRFLQHPQEEIVYLTEYARATSEMDKQINITNIPVTMRIYDLKDASMKQLVQVEGVVIQRGKPLMRAAVLSFKCKSCGFHVAVKQTQQYREYPKEPCPSCEGKKWVHDYSKSEFTNYQEIYIQELIENTPIGTSPEKIKVVLTGNLIRRCEPGESVKIVGILNAYDQSSKSVNIELDYHIEATSLINNTEADTLTLTDEDRLYVQNLMKQPEHMGKIIQSIAPTIYGLETVKEALAYQQCEGQEKFIKKQRKRGQFHILLAGSPGCGKSELGDFMVMCHPKGRKAVGRGATGVGLTATVVKEGEQFVLKAGEMPLADNGFLFVDEIEKMNPTDSSAMHPGMEQQEIRISKADISAVLKTRCSILAACNPIGGVWVDEKFPTQNLSDGDKGLALTLLDRFALKFVIRQNTDSALEKAVLGHIMKANSGDGEALETPYDLETLRKIFAYARTINITINPNVNQAVEEFCMVLFEASKRGEISVITRRLPNDLTRIAEASARLHGRATVEIEDVENAKRLIVYSLKEYGLDPLTGKVNEVDALYGEPKTRRGMMREAPAVLKRLCDRNVADKTQTTPEEFIDYASKLWRVTTGEVNEILATLLKDGTFYKPNPYALSMSPGLIPTTLNTPHGEEHNDTDG